MCRGKLEAATRVELVMMVLQTIALPLGYAAPIRKEGITIAIFPWGSRKNRGALLSRR